MTYIEFFEKDAIENVCSSLIAEADTVVLVGSQPAQLERHAARYERLMASLGKNVRFTYRQVNRNNLDKAVESLSYIVENYEDCVFDLTGGEDLYLVAMGIVFERYRDRNIQMHRFNIRSNTLYDCDLDGRTVLENEAPALSVEDNIRLYGGDVIYGTGEFETFRWEWDDEFEKDIRALWSVCAEHTGRWNNLIGTLAMMAQQEEKSLHSRAKLAAVKVSLGLDAEKFETFRGFLRKLEYIGVINGVSCDECGVELTYKNEQIKRCLTKEGQMLELWVYLLAYWAAPQGRDYVYNDVQTGIVIDWDGDDDAPSGARKLTNEIDVMMMHGCVPVFVSCKNGTVAVDELYKLNTVAARFGGKYAKKALVLSADVSQNGHLKYIRQRAEELGIRVVDDVARKSAQELEKELATLWFG